MNLTHTEDLNALRKNAYPPLEDLADAVYWQSRGDDTKMQKYMARVEAVKRQFPKI